LLPYYCL